eukprot:387031-Pyramimonas_sp.AAC.1
MGLPAELGKQAGAAQKESWRPARGARSGRGRAGATKQRQPDSSRESDHHDSGSGTSPHIDKSLKYLRRM